jgi:hypothetical protein
VLAEKQEKQNGNVARLQKEGNARQQVADEFQRFQQSMEKHKKRWIWYVAGGVIAVLLVMVVYDMIGIRGIVDLIR